MIFLSLPSPHPPLPSPLESLKNVNRTLGVIPEIKHPSFYSGDNVEKGRDPNYFEDTVLSILEDHDYDTQRDYRDPKLGHFLIPSTWHGYPGPVMIQSFEVDNLKYLHSQTTVPLVQLVAAERLGQIRDPEEMAEVAEYAAVTSAEIKSVCLLSVRLIGWGGRKFTT